MFGGIYSSNRGTFLMNTLFESVLSVGPKLSWARRVGLAAALTLLAVPTSLALSPQPDPPSGHPPATTADATAFLARFPLGECALAWVEEDDNHRAKIVAFGRDVSRFQALDRALIDATGTEALIILQLVSEAQCPALGLIKRAIGHPRGALTMRVVATEASHPTSHTATVDGVQDGALALLGVDAKGKLHPISHQDDGDGTARATFTAAGQGEDQQMLVILALTAPELPDLSAASGRPAAPILSALTEDLARFPGAVAIALEAAKVSAPPKSGLINQSGPKPCETLRRCR